MTATTSGKAPKTRALFASKGPNDPGAELLIEARAAVGLRQWRTALPILRSLQQIRPNDLEVDELLAVTASHRRQREEAQQSIRRLEASGARASNWNAIASARLATHDFADADVAARQALDLDPESVSGWQALAASYAGLGWFEESEECLDKAEALAEPLAFERWQLGRAVNKWSLTNTRALIVAIVLLPILWLLSLAVASSSPLLVREFRLAQLSDRFRHPAVDAWRTEHRLRLMYATGTFAAVALWAASAALPPA